MNKNFPLISFFFVCVACAIFVAANAHSATIKERMAARLPAINMLKDQGVLGENNAGFLEYRSSGKPQEEMIIDENRDRSAVYAAIARKEGASVAAVGQRRAQMIVDIGKTGHWFQRPDGTWYQK